METILIALGGNALLSPRGEQTAQSEIRNADRAMQGIAKLAKTGRYRIVITHGNGPQVGNELLRNEHSKSYVQPLPLYMLNAETQATIGDILQTALLVELARRHVRKGVSVLLTHAIVAKNDPAFRRPTKPVGPVYTHAELQRELRLRRFSYVRTSGGYRRVVASPRPMAVLESQTIKQIANSDIVIAGGGGGIPVVERGDGYAGIDAVIDKDLTSQVLANAIGAKRLVILTDIDYVYGDAKRRASPILYMKAGELGKRLGVFEEGTMRPKLDACVRFIENGGREARIGNLFRLHDIMKGGSGTRIT